MKVSWNKKPTKLIIELLRDVEATKPKLLEAFSKEVEISARRNFNRAIMDISGDNPYVSVVRTISGDNAKITCIGEQVLFAEFGAGTQNTYYEKTILVNSHSISKGGATYYVKPHERVVGYNSKGFKSYGMEEYMPRPSGIVSLGEYGKGHGKDDFWVYNSINGRENNMTVRWRMNRQGLFVMATKGTKPVRALYRARNTAINKLQSGRLKIK